MKFYLGTHKPGWLERPDVGVPLFISRRQLAARASLPRAAVSWALDSGGFTELNTAPAGSPVHEWTHAGALLPSPRVRYPHRWQITPEEYVEQVARFAAEIGRMDWAAPMDWMCEPWILRDTGLTVEEHQRRTTDNLLRLWDLGGRELGIIPVLQGWAPEDYPRHVAMYAAAGVDLTTEPVVGVGSVCRRQNTHEALGIFRELADLVGPRLHGFGLKGAAFTLGVERYLASADSLAWSYNARRADPLPGCSHGVTGAGRCNNCPRYALAWRRRTLARAAMAPATLF